MAKQARDGQALAQNTIPLETPLVLTRTNYLSLLEYDFTFTNPNCVSLVLPLTRKGTLLDTSITQCESYHGECNHGVTIQVWVGLDVLNKATVG